MRRTIGDDVDGACGQLRFNTMNEKKSAEKSDKSKVKKTNTITKEKTKKVDSKISKTGKTNRATTKKDDSKKPRSRKSYK